MEHKDRKSAENEMRKKLGRFDSERRRFDQIKRTCQTASTYGCKSRPRAEGWDDGLEQKREDRKNCKSKIPKSAPDRPSNWARRVALMFLGMCRARWHQGSKPKRPETAKRRKPAGGFGRGTRPESQISILIHVLCVLYPTFKVALNFFNFAVVRAPF